MSEVKNYLYIVLGSAFIALGVVWFFMPNSITTGGTPGIALLLHHLTGVTVGSLMLLINIPLLIIGIKVLGKHFAIRTVVAIILISALIDILVEVFHVGALTSNILLVSVFGGIFIGFGVGFILQGKASAGGPTIIARILSANFDFKPGQVVLFFDFLIVISFIAIFKDAEKAMWSIISIYITSRCIDLLLSRGPSKKVVHLVSNKSEALSEKIIAVLGDSGSIIKGTGLHQNEEKTIIFIVVELRKLRQLREIIKENDPDAFMVVMNASELLGRGA